MYAIGTVLNRQLPVVVDKQSGVVALAEGNSGGNVVLDLFIRQILNPQLKGSDACVQQTGNPFNAVDYRV
ncbi:hypothetical protein D3C80_1994680 [compost metagenome]